VIDVPKPVFLSPQNRSALYNGSLSSQRFGLSRWTHCRRCYRILRQNLWLSVVGKVIYDICQRDFSLDFDIRSFSGSETYKSFSISLSCFICSSYRKTGDIISHRFSFSRAGRSEKVCSEGFWRWCDAFRRILL